jgi:hypothetical protein
MPMRNSHIHLNATPANAGKSVSLYNRWTEMSEKLIGEDGHRRYDSLPKKLLRTKKSILGKHSATTCSKITMGARIRSRFQIKLSIIIKRRLSWE